MKSIVTYYLSEQEMVLLADAVYSGCVNQQQQHSQEFHRFLLELNAKMLAGSTITIQLEPVKKP